MNREAQIAEIERHVLDAEIEYNRATLESCMAQQRLTRIEKKMRQDHSSEKSFIQSFTQDVTERTLAEHHLAKEKTREGLKRVGEVGRKLVELRDIAAWVKKGGRIQPEDDEQCGDGNGESSQQREGQNEQK